MLQFSTDQWIIVGLVFLLGLFIGGFIFTGGGRKWKHRFRNERMMRAEEKAARLPAIMTIPLILFILPTLFIVILGPAACSIHDSFING